MPSSSAAIALLLSFAPCIAGEGACPTFDPSTASDLEAIASVQLLQSSFSVQKAAAAEGAGAKGADAGGAGNTCADPGDGLSRVWFACLGEKVAPASAHERASGAKVGSEMRCTPEVDFKCLCCMDFSKPLPFDRHFIVKVNAMQLDDGAEGAMEDEAVDQAPGKRVIICTKTPLEEAEAPGRVVEQEVQCFPQQYTPEQLQERGTDGSGEPGQIFFSKRIGFMLEQDLPASAIPTCKATVGDACPVGTPKAGTRPNSASDDALASLGDGASLLQSWRRMFGGATASGTSVCAFDAG